MTEATLYKDPVFDEILWREVQDKQCLVCVNRMDFVLTNDVQCSNGKRWPQCLTDKKNGFRLDEDK